jgi:hypothetical protein
MEHKEAEQNLAVERYLLGDMTASELDQFEDHLFTCRDCADSVQSGAAFVENARSVFKEPELHAASERKSVRMKWKQPSWWQRFMSPAFAPALAALALLCVAGYQRMVVIPGLRTQLAAVTEPQPLPSFALHAASRGAQQTIVVPEGGHFFNLYLDVAQESASGYSCAILDASGSVQFAEHLSPATPESGGTLNLLIGRSRLRAGDYTLVVSTESAHPVEISRYPFSLKYR